MPVAASSASVINVGITVEKKSSPLSKVTKPNGASEVRVLKPTEYKEAAATLAEAFCDDHVIRYPIDTPDREHWSEGQRFDLHRQVFEYIVYAHCLKGLVLSIGENYGCIALWMPPGKNMDDWLTILRSGMWRLSYQLSAEGRKRFFEEFLPLLGNTKTEVLGDRDDESWYLVYIGTKEESRGKGYARKLVDYVTKRADAEGRACYLESSNAINRIIYPKMGFSIFKQVYLDPGNERIELDIMVREPTKTATKGQ